MNALTSYTPYSLLFPTRVGYDFLQLLLQI